MFRAISSSLAPPEFCTSGDTDRIMVTVLGMVAEMERKFILERQRTGIEAAKAKGGVYKGRKPINIYGDWWGLPVCDCRGASGQIANVTRRKGEPRTECLSTHSPRICREPEC
jgi:Resolvase, N terminal domain